ncbi:hypothetical protein B0H17DRAFT_1174051 [Mycena rosella]|uniref:F-box domain-containing protein n=1 Tax=Mycena rosella TaxID=1033263 RepID=A0AAD7GZA3_MYCRO|nr:hypothetical protein B0H17DRAFT_1174051 [Mycena rosella]
MDPTTPDYCTKVPAELWLRIWQSSSRQDLQNLIFVSHYFRDLCQPLFFRHQRFKVPQLHEIDGRNWVPTTRHLHNSQIRLRKLAATRALAVREWDFRGSLKLSSLIQDLPEILHIHLIPETYSKLVQTFCTTLGDYQNLRSLHLFGFTVDSPFRQSLASLERLEELAMEGCETTGRTGPLLTLRHLYLTAARHLSSLPSSQRPPDNTPIQPIDITSPQELRTLTVDASRDACALLPALYSNNVVSLHIRLSENTQERSLAFAFLEHSPQVAHIEISRPSTLSGTLPRRLPLTAIPNLTSFKGSASLAGLIISERPVSAVEFSGSVHRKEGIIKALADITHSSVPLRSLSLDIPIEALLEISATIATHFPGLRELSFGLLTPAAVRNSGYEIIHYPIDDYINDPIYGIDWSTDDYESLGNYSGFIASGIDSRTVDLSDTDNLLPVTSNRRSFQAAQNIAQGPAPILDQKLASSRKEKLNIPDPDEHDLAMQILSDPCSEKDEAWSLGVLPTDVGVTGSIVAICMGRVALPAGLDTLRLKGVLLKDGNQTLAVQRHVVLALEQQLPALHTLTLGIARDVGSNIWTRNDNTWTLRGSSTTIVSAVLRK